MRPVMNELRDTHVASSVVDVLRIATDGGARELLRDHTKHTGPGFGFATASFSQHGRLEPPRRRANRARAVHKVAGTFDNVSGAQGVEWVPHCKRAVQGSARSHCGAAPRRRSMSGLQGQRFSAARGLRHGPGRPHRAPEAAGVASLMTCATRRRGQLRFHNAPHFWHPPASRA